MHAFPWALIVDLLRSPS